MLRVHIGMRSERQSRQCLQLVRFECMQVVGATQYPQNFEITERDDDEDYRLPFSNSGVLCLVGVSSAHSADWA